MCEMSNVKTVPNCPKCQTQGTLVRKSGLFLKLECPTCNEKWQTLLVSKRGGMKI
jgi:transposase-like protein